MGILRSRVVYNTSVSVAAVPAFHDSAFHHLKCVIASDDDGRIVARERSPVSKNTEPPAFQVWAASAGEVLGQEGFPPRGVPEGEGLGRVDGQGFVRSAEA